MFQTCVGEIGISPREFWFMTYKETILAIRGYENRQMRDWERARLVAYQVYAGIPKKGANKPITHYLPLASDLRNRAGKDNESLNEFRKRLIEKKLKEKEG